MKYPLDLELSFGTDPPANTCSIAMTGGGQVARITRFF